MTRFHHSLRIAAPLERVWAVLADLEAVQLYNPLVARARYLSDLREGVGASRECEFRPKGRARERVIAWNPRQSLTIELYESPWPLEFMHWETNLRQDGGDTVVTQTTDYRAKFGLLGRLLDALVMRRQLRRTLDRVLAGFKEFVESRSGATT